MNSPGLISARKIGIVMGVSSLLAMAAADAPASAQTSGANGTHDPSRMIESDGRFYVYSTGGGSKSSPDGLVWTQGPGLFPGGIPSSTTSVVSNNEGIWAPDVIYLNGQYYLYYSIANSSNACAVGLVTSPTLNPSSPNFKWTDRGLVVSNTGSQTYCTIDPAPALDATGNLWLAWGSGYSHPSTSNTIWVTRLDNTTGLASSADSAKPGHALEQGHIEASYIYYHSGYYYLFWNSGGCCNGVSSNYVIHVARSQTITGGYTGSKVFYSSTGNVHGPGHIGIYDQCGASRFTYHYYPNNGSVLGENELTWGSDGWPGVGPVSTTPLTPCGQTGGGGTSGTSTGGTTGGAQGGTTGGAGGGAGTDLGSGSAGTSAGGAPSGSGGTLGGGGDVGGTGGSAGPATGGSTDTGGTNGGSTETGGRGTGGSVAGGSGGTVGVSDNGGSQSGCSCDVPVGRGLNLAGLALLVGATLGAARRGSRRKRQR